MLYIWVGTCRQEISGPDEMFEALYESSWLDDPLVVRMIEDVDKNKVENRVVMYNYMGDLMSPLDISGGVKTLIMMYKRPDYLYKGTSMGDNCGKWLKELSKIVDCYMTLRYDLKVGEVDSEEPFVCTFVNNGYITKTVKDYFQEFVTLSSMNDGNFQEWIDNPFIQEDDEEYIPVERMSPDDDGRDRSDLSYLTYLKDAVIDGINLYDFQPVDHGNSDTV